MIISENKPIRVSTDDGWEIVLQSPGWSDTKELWIGQVNKRTGEFYNATVGKDGYLVMTKGKEGQEYIPTIRVKSRVWEGIARALQGIIPNEEEKESTSELKATKYHLEDMRKLLKL